jgi:hypothetical protein
MVANLVTVIIRCYGVVSAQVSRVNKVFDKVTFKGNIKIGVPFKSAGCVKCVHGNFVAPKLKLTNIVLYTNVKPDALGTGRAIIKPSDIL